MMKILLKHEYKTQTYWNKALVKLPGPKPTADFTFASGIGSPRASILFIQLAPL